MGSVLLLLLLNTKTQQHKFKIQMSKQVLLRHINAFCEANFAIRCRFRTLALINGPVEI